MQDHILTFCVKGSIIDVVLDSGIAAVNERSDRMASVNWQKMTKQSAGAMIRHNGKKERVEGNHTNKHIDKNKSELNIYIGADDYNEMYQAMLKRVDEVDKLYPPLKKLKANERIICESLEYKCPQAIYDLGYDSAVKFFNDVHKMFIDFFGAENVHGSCVHFDEVHDYVDPKTKHTYTSLPHAHSLVSCYVEWEEDIKKGGKKTGEKRKRKGINGKNFEKRERYNKLNKKIDNYCLKEFGIHFMTGEQAQKKTVELLKSESELAEANLKVQAAQEQLRSEQQAIEELRTEHQQYRELKVSKENLAQNIKVKSGGIFGSKEETVTMSKADFDTILEQSTAYVANYDKIKVADERLAELKEREEELEIQKKLFEKNKKDSFEKAYNKQREAEALISEYKEKVALSNGYLADAQWKYTEQEHLNEIHQNAKQALEQRNQEVATLKSQIAEQEKRHDGEISALKLNKKTEVDVLSAKIQALQEELHEKESTIERWHKGISATMLRTAAVINILKQVLCSKAIPDKEYAMIKSIKVYSEEIIDGLPKKSELRKKIDKALETDYVPQVLNDLNNKIYEEIQEEKKERHQTRGMTL